MFNFCLIAYLAKKTCRSYNETFENFLNESLRSQARPSFFSEVQDFSKDQQMITCIDGCRKYYSVKEEEDPNDLVGLFQLLNNNVMANIEINSTDFFKFCLYFRFQALVKEPAPFFLHQLMFLKLSI